MEHRVDCRCAIFAQSRSLEHVVCTAWRDAFFLLLVERPLDTLYSIAFSLSFSPTFGANVNVNVDDDDVRKSAFVASRELFDLLDDYVRDTDQLSREELLRARNVSHEAYLLANKKYLEAFDELERFIDRYIFLEAANNPTSRANVGEKTTTDGDAGDDNARGTKVGDDDVATATTTVVPTVVDDDDRIRMVRLFERLNEYSSLLPFSVNTNCSRTIQRFDVEAIARADSRVLLKEPYSFYRDATTSCDVNDTMATMVAWTPVELFVRYAYTLQRFESFEMIKREISVNRGIEIFPILLPIGSVWQAGTSQILWILLHTLYALSIARHNVYLSRLLVLLKNLSFFVWCGECRLHWRANLGDEYFELYARLNDYSRERLPIDVMLVRSHNTVASNGRLNRRLCAWTLAQIVVDYREFVERLVLRRRPRLCNRPDCLGRRKVVPVLYGGESDITFHASASRRACFIRPYYTVDNIVALDPTDVLNIARREWLLAKLWRQVDSNVPIGGL